MQGVRAHTAFGLVLVGLVAPSLAHADEPVAEPVAETPVEPKDKQVCAEAYTTAQVKRDAARLMEARGALRTCSRPVCPAFIAKDCTEWLVEVEARMPSIVLSAKEGDTERFDTTVSMDGVLLAGKLDGKAIEVDPGIHTFVFTLPTASSLEVKMAVKEGQKAQSVVAAFPGSRAVHPVETAPPPNPSLRILGYGVGVAGIVGIGIGAFFGARAIAKNSASKEDCDADNFCGPTGKEARLDAQQAATVSTVGFAAGGLLVAGGLALVLLSPSQKTAAMRVAPLMGAGTGGLSFMGGF